MKWFAIVAVLLGLASCGPDSKWNVKRISDKEQGLLQLAKTGDADSAHLMSLLGSYEAFASANPGDSMSAEYLFRSADFYRYLQRPLKSIQIYERIAMQFPQHSKAPLSIFLQGFLYENDLRNYTAAEAQYHRFIVKYPNHPMIKDVIITMKNLGKTPEQLVAEFKAKAAIDSAQAAVKQP